MPVVTDKDVGGDTIRFMEVDGTRYPYVSAIDQEQAIRASRDIVPCDDDVLLIAYPKSGTHWLWEVLSMLQQGKAETIPNIKQGFMIEAISSEQAANIPQPRVLNAHFRFDQIPKAMKEKKTKIVLCHRNPKDVAVSLYYHHHGLKNIYEYDGKWENWFPLYLEGKTDYGSWFDFVLGWEKAMHENPDYPIHLMTYEDMKHNGDDEVRKLAKYLNLDVNDDICSAIAEKCQFSKMKRDKAQYATEFWKNMWRSESQNFYRKGVIGDWKNLFTVAQNEAFDEMYQRRMEGSGLTFEFE